MTAPTPAQTPEEVADRLAVACGCLVSDARETIEFALRAGRYAAAERARNAVLREGHDQYEANRVWWAATGEPYSRLPLAPEDT